MIISDEQVKQIANDIVLDVCQYIKEHQKEYEEFLKTESADLKSSDQQKGFDLDENDST